jgi:iron complex transport system ATP-binding protein
MSATPVFESRALTFDYPGAPRLAVADVSLQVPRGALYAVLGPNGSGKSTLVKLLLGALRPGAGMVTYAGRSLAAWSRRALARQIGVVPQIEEPAFSLTVWELAAMSRYPHLGLLGREGPADRRAIARALKRCEVLEFASRPFSTLSGGERQRVRIARALAQEPETLVLDEPTLSLDLHHEMAIFELLRELVTEDGVTVVIVTHHANLAARYASHLLLLHEGRVAAEGPPSRVLSRPIVERIYQWQVAATVHPGPGHDAGAPQVVPLSRSDRSAAGACRAHPRDSAANEEIPR